MAKLTTKNKAIVVELKDSITYGEYQKIVEVYLNEGTEGEKFQAARKLNIESVLLSIDGSTEDLFNRLMKLERADGEEIYNAITAVSNPKVDGNS